MEMVFALLRKYFAFRFTFWVCGASILVYTLLTLGLSAFFSSQDGFIPFVSLHTAGFHSLEAGLFLFGF
jgi:hypothetical protein